MGSKMACLNTAFYSPRHDECIFALLSYKRLELTCLPVGCMIVGHAGICTHCHYTCALVYLHACSDAERMYILALHSFMRLSKQILECKHAYSPYVHVDMVYLYLHSVFTLSLSLSLSVCLSFSLLHTNIHMCRHTRAHTHTCILARTYLHTHTLLYYCGYACLLI